MDYSWTRAEQVKEGLSEVGFDEISLMTEKGLWQWENYVERAKNFFEGVNPGNGRMLEAWKTLGRAVDEIVPIHTQILEADYGQRGVQRDGHLPAHLKTARN